MKLLPTDRHLAYLQQSEGIDNHCQGFKCQLCMDADTQTHMQVLINANFR